MKRRSLKKQLSDRKSLASQQRMKSLARLAADDQPVKRRQKDKEGIYSFTRQIEVFLFFFRCLIF